MKHQIKFVRRCRALPRLLLRAFLLGTLLTGSLAVTAGLGLPTAAADPHWSKSAEGKPDLSKSHQEEHDQKCNECRKEKRFEEKESKDESKSSIQRESSDPNTATVPTASAIAFVSVNVNDVSGASEGNSVPVFFPVGAFPVFFPVETFPIFFPVETFPGFFPVGSPGFFPGGFGPGFFPVGFGPGFDPVGGAPGPNGAGGVPGTGGAGGAPGMPHTGSDPGDNPLP